MSGLAGILQNRLLPSFALQDEGDELTQPSRGINQEFVDLSRTEEETLFKAVRLNDVDRISMLLRHGANVNMINEGDPCLVKCPSLFRNIQMKKYCPLHVAALHSNMQTIELLCAHGADINQRDGNDRTPLFLATTAARYDVVKYLLRKGADVNAQTSSKRTALMEAVCLNRLHLVDELVRAGSDLELEDVKGTTALDHAVLLPMVPVQVVERLLQGGCNVNKGNIKGATPLMFAVSLKKADKIEALLRAGAEINATDNSHKTAFHIATNDGQGVYIAKLLLGLGAHPDVRDKRGKTPLDYAVAQGKLRVLQMLLLADCDRDYTLFNSEMVQKLCEKVPVFHDWLNDEMYNPKSLKRICRGNIRKFLQIEGLTRIDELPIPSTLKDFLLVKYFE